VSQHTPAPQIAVLDTGGQYTHLIARKIRELGVYAEVAASETSLADLAQYRGIVISGGPGSVYEASCPNIDPALLSSGIPILGICYGIQLISHLLDGKVEKGERGEYGLATLEITAGDVLFDGVLNNQPVWMSHRDTVVAAPGGFHVFARTETCAVAAMSCPEKRQYGVQFHPEVVHTPEGSKILSNFLFRICGCAKDWNPRARVPAIEDRIREVTAGRKVFFFVSGGVDSTVAYTLCLRALGDDRVHGAYVDTGLMREGETDFVRGIFASLGAKSFHVEDARSRFLAALSGVTDPERKRHIIGEMFVEVQDRILQSGHYLDGDWILGQGTIYPDTIESGGTAKADLIKTHHNRVAGIQKLIESNRIIEPLSSFYKDEVREAGRELGLPPEFLDRHPFPGPGLAIRCLCSESDYDIRQDRDGWILPVHSVGVQGDSRSYRPALAIDALDHDRATRITNERSDVNRIVGVAGSHLLFDAMKVQRSQLSSVRLERLREADSIVRRLSRQSGFENEVWQFPVVLIPVGNAQMPDSVVLRPIHSVDGMTARSVLMPAELLNTMTSELLALDGTCAVFYDLTHKPPGTIEWE
jgi:GMP synthase (glutamine-hydrolysing)